MNITDARVFHLRAPLEVPYKTTFGTMTHRQAVIIVLEDSSGVTGVGESWINFPLWAPWERVQAFTQGFFPLIIGSEIEDIPEFTSALFKRIRAAALQSATLGPAMQALCAVETALWDLRARISDVPLDSLFGKTPEMSVKLYGSGINPPVPYDILDDCMDRGIDCFKIKVGYGDDRDRDNIKNLRKHVGSEVGIAVDVNRNWSLEKTMDWMDFLMGMNIRWLEEPLIPAEEDRYGELHEQAGIPIAAGENFLILPESRIEEFAERSLDIVQPSIVKNCRFSDAVTLLGHVETRGARLFPHYLGSAPGLAASIHLASLTEESCMEWDINPNPLRTSLFTESFRIEDGFLHLTGKPGIGWEIDRERMEKWVVTHPR